MAAFDGWMEPIGIRYSGPRLKVEVAVVMTHYTIYNVLPNNQILINTQYLVLLKTALFESKYFCL